MLILHQEPKISLPCFIHPKILEVE